MSGDTNGIYRFKSFQLNVLERQLVNGEKSISLTPKAFDVLVHLVENAGHLVGKDELMDAVWADSFVEQNNLPRTIHSIRTALGQRDNGNVYIETIPTKG
ncbi:MAG: winged helix-turn-helix domain-containing protein [Pyrinomonadaceae bacterium]